MVHPDEMGLNVLMCFTASLKILILAFWKRWQRRFLMPLSN